MEIKYEISSYKRENFKIQRMADYSIIPFIRDDKPLKRNKKFPIYLRVRIYDRETKLPSHLDVEPSEWSKKRKEPKDNFLKSALNSKIFLIEKFLNSQIAEGKELSIDTLKSHLNKINPKIKNNLDESFYHYMEKFIERKSTYWSPGTKLIFDGTYNVLKNFRAYLNIKDINLKFIEEFDEYLIKMRHNSNGGRMNRHRNLKSIILDMIKHGVKVENPYIFFKTPTSKPKEVFLEKFELEKLRLLSKSKNLSNEVFKTLELYLFACYCGFRVSDILTLRWSHVDLEKKIITKVQHKTKNEVNVPIFDKAYYMLNHRYKTPKPKSKDDLIFDTLSVFLINRTLKRIAEMVDIKKNITFHTARHTFATLLVMDGVPIYTIQKFLGHTSTHMTERYLKYDLNVVQENIDKIKTFK